MTARRADAAFTLAGAAWGLGCGIALATLWFAPPHEGQLPNHCSALAPHSLQA